MSPPAPGTIDSASAIAHEISEVMGRIGACGVQTNPSGAHIFGPLDLFRFTAPGTLNVYAGPANYSLDGSNLLLSFNDPSTQPMADAADWNFAGDCFGGFEQGVRNTFSTTDYIAMRGIGYTGVAAPAPIFAI